MSFNYIVEASEQPEITVYSSTLLNLTKVHVLRGGIFANAVSTITGTDSVDSPTCVLTSLVACQTLTSSDFTFSCISAGLCHAILKFKCLKSLLLGDISVFMLVTQRQCNCEL